jgi:hypothetical protein
VLQREQVAPRGGARHVRALAGLAGGEARVGVVEGLDDAHAALQAGDPVALVQARGGGGVVLAVLALFAHGRGVCRRSIAGKLHSWAVKTLALNDYRISKIDDRPFCPSWRCGKGPEGL